MEENNLLIRVIPRLGPNQQPIDLAFYKIAITRLSNCLDIVP